jgi:GNAT superfamily N-acetyltransferase
MDVRVGPLPTSGPDVDAWCEIYAAGQARDSGSTVRAADIAATIHAAPAQPDIGRFGAWAATRLAGVAEVRRDGHTGAFTRIYVGPAHRRAGVGRALSVAVFDWAADRQCRTVKATVVAGTAGEPFANALGARVAIKLVTVVRDLDTPAPSVPTPAGVRVARWTNHTPDPWLDAYAVLRRAVGDAPGAHLQMDVQARTGQWVREWERARTASGNELWVSAAVTDDGGDLVAFTEVEVPATGGADQHDTAVLPGRRGHGLGTWLKADMIDWLRADRPEVSHLTSTINERNVPMLRTCAALGFRETWRRRLVVCDVEPG